MPPQPAPQALLAMGSGESAAFLAAAPRTHRRFRLHPLHDVGRRSSSPRRAPQIPKTHHPRSLFNFDSSVFPRFPRTQKGPTGAKNSKRGGGFLRDFGCNSEKDLHQEGSNPTLARSGLMEFTFPRNCCHVRGWAMVRLGIRYSGPPFKGLLNRTFLG